MVTRAPWIFRVIFVAALSGLALAQSAKQKSEVKADSSPGAAVHIMGLDGVKHGAHGKLTLNEGKLSFKTPSTQTDISLSSVQDIFVGEESRQIGGTPLTLVKMAAPFGTGRALSLFAHQKIDNLTVEFVDDNGGLHDAIFTMPRGRAGLLKKTLIEQGAHATTPAAPEATASSAKEPAKEKK